MFLREKKKKKEENSTKWQKPNIQAAVCDNNIKYDWGKKKLKSLIGHLSANKIDKYSEGREKKFEKSKRIYRTSQKIKIINVFKSLLSGSFPSLGVTIHLTSLGYLPTQCWSLDLLWGQLRF